MPVVTGCTVAPALC